MGKILVSHDFEACTDRQLDVLSTGISHVISCYIRLV